MLKSLKKFILGEPEKLYYEDIESMVNIPIVITDISLNTFEEVVSYSLTSYGRLTEEELIKSFIMDLQASRMGIGNFLLISGSMYNNDNILKIDVKGKAVKV